jgi:hypothetical protein
LTTTGLGENPPRGGTGFCGLKAILSSRICLIFL